MQAKLWWVWQQACTSVYICRPYTIPATLTPETKLNFVLHLLWTGCMAWKECLKTHEQHVKIHRRVRECQQCAVRLTRLPTSAFWNVQRTSRQHVISRMGQQLPEDARRTILLVFMHTLSTTMRKRKPAHLQPHGHAAQTPAPTSDGLHTTYGRFSEPASRR